MNSAISVQEMEQMNISMNSWLMIKTPPSSLQNLILFQCIDKARDLLDAELTAMAGESYSRAYGVSVSLLAFILLTAAL